MKHENGIYTLHTKRGKEALSAPFPSSLQRIYLKYKFLPVQINHIRIGNVTHLNGLHELKL